MQGTDEEDREGRGGARTSLRALATHPPLAVLATTAVVAAMMITWGAWATLFVDLVMGFPSILPPSLPGPALPTIDSPSNNLPAADFVTKTVNSLCASSIERECRLQPLDAVWPSRAKGLCRMGGVRGLAASAPASVVGRCCTARELLYSSMPLSSNLRPHYAQFRCKRTAKAGGTLRSSTLRVAPVQWIRCWRRTWRASASASPTSASCSVCKPSSTACARPLPGAAHLETACELFPRPGKMKRGLHCTMKGRHFLSSVLPAGPEFARGTFGPVSFDRSGGRWVGDTVGRAPVIVAGLLSSCVANAVLGPLPWLGLPPGGHASVWTALVILVGAHSLAATHHAHNSAQLHEHLQHMYPQYFRHAMFCSPAGLVEGGRHQGHQAAPNRGLPVRSFVTGPAA